MNEEAAFISALLAEPRDLTTLLVYADWLDERADPRAEYLRLLAADQPDRQQLMELRRTLDPFWGCVVTERLVCGCTVRINEGAFRNSLGEVIDLRLRTADEMFVTDEVMAVVRVILWGRPVDVPLGCSTVERAEPAR